MASLYYITIVFMFVYSAIATGFYYAAHAGNFQDFQKYEYTWPIPLTVFLLGILFFEHKEIRKHLRLCDFFKKNLDFLAILFGLLCLRLYSINTVSIWGDEEFQANGTYYYFPVLAGGNMHQPPLDMVLVNFAVKIFGYKAWALRIHSAVFSSLAAAFLYLTAKDLSKSKLVALICAVFFAMHEYVIQFGYEARPISSGMFFEIIFVSLIYSLLNDPNSPFRKKYWSLAGCTFLFLSSLGLQPAFIVAGTLSFLILYSVLDRTYLKYALCVLFGLLCFLPIQAAIVSVAPPKFTKTSGIDVGLFLNEFKLENFYFLRLYFEPFGYIILAFFVVIFIVSAIKKLKPFSAATAYLVFCGIFFLGVLIPFFRSHVDYSLNEYYLILCLPLVFLVFSCQWMRLTESILNWRILKLITLACVTAVAGYYFHRGNLIVQKSDHPDHEDQEGAYTLIKEKSPDLRKNVILRLFTEDSKTHGTWLTGFIGKAFYYAPPEEDVSPWASPLECYQDALLRGKGIENIFFLYYSTLSQMPLHANYQIAELQGVELYHLKSKPTSEAVANNVINFIEPIIQKGLERKVLYSLILEYVVMSYDYLKDENKRLLYLNLYKNFDGFKKRSEYLDQELLKVKND